MHKAGKSEQYQSSTLVYLVIFIVLINLEWLQTTAGLAQLVQNVDCLTTEWEVVGSILTNT